MMAGKLQLMKDVNAANVKRRDEKIKKIGEMDAEKKVASYFNSRIAFNAGKAQKLPGVDKHKLKHGAPVEDSVAEAEKLSVSKALGASHNWKNSSHQSWIRMTSQLQ